MTKTAYTPQLLAALQYVSGKLIALADAETDNEKIWIIDDMERVVHNAIANAKGA